MLVAKGHAARRIVGTLLALVAILFSAVPHTAWATSSCHSGSQPTSRHASRRAQSATWTKPCAQTDACRVNSASVADSGNLPAIQNVIVASSHI